MARDVFDLRGSLLQVWRYSNPDSHPLHLLHELESEVRGKYVFCVEYLGHIRHSRETDLAMYGALEILKLDMKVCQLVRFPL